MYWALIILHIFVCTFLVLVVLLQAGKGGGIGIAFGGGGSQTVFGSSGAGNFLTRLTAIFATIFFVNSLALAYMSSGTDAGRLQKLSAQKAEQKRTEDAAKKKVVDDVEKAREALKKTGEQPAPGTGTTAPEATPPAGSTTTPGTGAPAATPPATGTAPQGAAPSGSTAPATAPGTSAPPTTTPPPPATPPPAAPAPSP